MSVSLDVTFEILLLGVASPAEEAVIRAERGLESSSDHIMILPAVVILQILLRAEDQIARPANGQVRRRFLVVGGVFILIPI